MKVLKILKPTGVRTIKLIPDSYSYGKKIPSSGPLTEAVEIELQKGEEVPSSITVFARGEDQVLVNGKVFVIDGAKEVVAHHYTIIRDYNSYVLVYQGELEAVAAKTVEELFANPV